MSRKVVSLLHRVRSIEWDVCTNEEAACHPEAMLIAVLLPQFNGAGKVWPVRPDVW